MTIFDKCTLSIAPKSIGLISKLITFVAKHTYVAANVIPKVSIRKCFTTKKTAFLKNKNVAFLFFYFWLKSKYAFDMTLFINFNLVNADVSLVLLWILSKNRNLSIRKSSNFKSTYS